MATIFEQIIEGRLEAEKVYEDEYFIAIKDKFPKAPVHLLLITKKLIACLQEMEEKDFFLMSKAVKIIQKLAKKFNIENNYKLVINNGKEGGQEIFHLHLHLLGGFSQQK